MSNAFDNVTFHDAKQDRDQRVGRGFRPDPRMERLAGMSEERRAATLEKLGASATLEYGYYTSAREAAKRLEEARS